MLNITVHGEPVGQGRISYGRHGRGYHSNGKALKPWRTRVQAAAVDLTGQHPHTKPPKPKGQKEADRTAKPCVVCGVMPKYHGIYAGPLAVDLVLTVVKPASAPKRRRTWPVTRTSGDWDHLGRAISDALTGVVWCDDSQVIDGRVRKVYPGEHELALDAPGAVIRVFEVTADE